MGPQLTTANKILIAAGQLDDEQGTFTAEDLIVRSWQVFPESFGLSGYGEKYPDSNRVLAKLMGSVGLCNRGWLEQVSTKTYRMTPAGRKFVIALKAQANDPNAAPLRPPRQPVVRGTDAPNAANLRGRPRGRDDERPETAPPTAAPATTSATSPSASSRPARTSAPPPPAPASRPAPAAPATASRPVMPPAPSAPRPAQALPARMGAPAPASQRTAPSPATTSPSIARSSGAASSASTGARAASGSGFEGTAALGKLMNSAAAQKWTRGTNVTFQDACGFWGISAGTHPSQLVSKIEDVEALLGRAVTRIQDTKTVISITDRLQANLAQIIGLQGLHKTMTLKYRRELESLRARLAESN